MLRMFANVLWTRCSKLAWNVATLDMDVAVAFARVKMGVGVRICH